MSPRSDGVDEARFLAQRIRAELGAEPRAARIGAGLTQRTVAHAAELSHAQVSRIERARLDTLSIDQASRVGRAVGLRLWVRAYPDGDPARDGPQRALLGRFQVRLPTAAAWATEVPLPIAGDRRAWDGLATLHGVRAGCEGETRLADIQALERRLALKLRDGGVDVVILIVADAASNRAILRLHREALRSLLPLDGRQILAAFAAGRLPSRSGVILL